MIFCMVAVRQKFSTFSTVVPLRPILIGIILWPCCGGTRRSSFGAPSSCQPVEFFGNVQALFNAAFRQQLQGPPCAGAAQRALPCDRGRHSARREPHAGLSCEESERTGPVARGRGGTLPRRIQRHSLVCRR